MAVFVVLETRLGVWAFISEFGVLDGKRGFPFWAFTMGFGALEVRPVLYVRNGRILYLILPRSIIRDAFIYEKTPNFILTSSLQPESKVHAETARGIIQTPRACTHSIMD